MAGIARLVLAWVLPVPGFSGASFYELVQRSLLSL